MPELFPKTGLKTRALFGYLSALTFLFILLEIGVFLLGSDLYLRDYRLVSNKLTIPLSVAPGVLYFFFAQCIIHVSFILLIFSLTLLIMVVFPRLYRYQDLVGLLCWLLGCVSILLANQLFYPNSKFSILITHLIPFDVGKIVLTIFLSILFIGMVFASYGLLLVIFRHIKIALIILCCFVGGIGFFLQPKTTVNDAATFAKPNIILIGVDGLRPDFLGFFGASYPTPQMDDFLNHATVFSESLTPLARTYPSWLSILTGEYPKKTNVRFNLSDQLDYDLSKTLPAMLKQQGYETIFGMDETRFSNIDKTFGFDEIVTPSIGFNDFFLGTLNDFPLSNLLSNTMVGKYLFPFTYSNRPVYTTYQPNSFIQLLTGTLEKPRTKPLFLAVHFCLTHYPYVWANHKRTVSIKDYPLAVQRVDEQIAAFWALLKENKLLEHSIVVLLSDHGEGFWLPGDRVTEAALFVPGLNNPNKIIPHFYPQSRYGEEVNQSVGHGVDVLGITQYHTVLGFRFLGLKGQQSAIVPGRVSLLDIKPTLLDFLGVPVSNPRGKSLLKYIKGEEKEVSVLGDFFTESDFAPEAVRTVHPETRDVLFQGIEYFQINPITTRLTVKKSMANLIISSKQYADFYGSWVLALYPQNNKPMLPILVNLKTGAWTNDLASSLAEGAPVAHMLQALRDFYGNDIKKIEGVSS